MSHSKFQLSKIICTLALFSTLLLWGCGRGDVKPEAASASLLQTTDTTVLPFAEQENDASNNTITNSRKNAITTAVKQISPAVVNITVTEVVQGQKRVSRNFGFFELYGYVPYKQNIKSIGSGFIISETGLVVTNAHVADDNAKKIIVSLASGEQYEATLVGADKLSDIALLKINAERKFPYAQFGDSNDVIVGEWAIAIGNPFGLFNATRPSVTVGVISAIHRDFRPNPQEPHVYLNMIQTDAAINQGNSGGPLVNSAGKVIGINTFIVTGDTGTGFVGLGFAIPSNRVKKIINELAKDGEYEKKFDLGMAMQPTTYRIVIQNQLVPVPVLFVTSVNQDGPAFKAGIVPGDVILQIGDTMVRSLMHAKALLREFEVGDSLRIEFIREGKRYETKIYLQGKVSAK